MLYQQALLIFKAAFRGLVWARGTTIWLAIVTSTELVLRRAEPELSSALLLSVSTNLHNLQTDPLNVLITSACFVSSTQSYLAFVAVCLLVLAPLENWIGTGRWLIALVLGHVGSTLVVAVGLTVADQVNHTDTSRAVDVGVSYGVRLLMAVFAYRWSGRLWWVVAALLATAAGIEAVIKNSFTEWGHFVAVLLGLALAPLLVRDRRTSDPLFDSLREDFRLLERHSI